MEKEMPECNLWLKRTKNPDKSVELTKHLEIDCEKLWAFHKTQGTLRLQVAVEETKKLCLECWWVDPAHASYMHDVYSPILVIVDISSLGNCRSDQPMLTHQLQTTMVMSTRTSCHSICWRRPPTCLWFTYDITLHNQKRYNFQK